MYAHIRTLALPALVAIAALPAQAAPIAIVSGTAYTQDFDTLAASGSAVPWANDATLAGWSLYTAAGVPVTTYGADNGSSNAGAFKSYGASGSSERAFGGLGSGGSYFGSPASGAVAGWITVAFTNAGPVAFQDFSVAFDGEQWRNGGNTNAQTMALSYGFGSSFATVSSWTPAGAGFDFTSPVTGATAAAVDGNGAGRVSGLGGTIVADWQPGQTLWLRWTEVNDVGNDHGLAIDDFKLTALAPVPEPNVALMLLAGLASVGFVARRRG